MRQVVCSSFPFQQRGAFSKGESSYHSLTKPFFLSVSMIVGDSVLLFLGCAGGVDVARAFCLSSPHQTTCPGTSLLYTVPFSFKAIHFAWTFHCYINLCREKNCSGQLFLPNDPTRARSPENARFMNTRPLSAHIVFVAWTQTRKTGANTRKRGANTRTTGADTRKTGADTRKMDLRPFRRKALENSAAQHPGDTNLSNE